MGAAIFSLPGAPGKEKLHEVPLYNWTKEWGQVTDWGSVNVSAGATMMLDHCTITGNTSQGPGAGLYTWQGTLTVVNSIVFGNSPRNWADGGGGIPSITYSDIGGGYNGEGNIDADPLFADPANGSFKLTADSPCINSGNPDTQYNDPDGSRSDMGACYYEGKITEIGYLDTPGNAHAVFSNGNNTFIGDQAGGLRIINTANPVHPEELGHFEAPGQAWEVDVHNNLAYLAATDVGLLIVDVSDPTNPREVGACETPGTAIGIEVIESIVYIGDFGNGLRVIDASDPANPHEIGSCDTPGLTYGLTVVGGLAYLADREGGLRLIDVSDPTNPREVGSYNIQGAAYDVAVVGGLVYVAADGGGIRVIDVSDPANPSEIGSYEEVSRAVGVVVRGNFAFIADYNFGLRVIDISDPTSPQASAQYQTPGNARGIAVFGDMAFIADMACGLRILDISEFTSGQQNDLPLIRVSPLTLAYSEVVVNSPATLPLSITNEGDAVLEVTAISSDNEQFTTDYTEAVTIAPKESRLVNVTFTPATFGTVTGLLTITSNAADNPSVALTGVGLAPDLAVTPQELHFGDVEFRRVSEPLTLTLTNEGNANLNITEMAFNDDKFTIIIPDTGVVILPGQYCDFPATFHATTVGNVETTLRIVSNDPDENPMLVAVTGKGVWIPESELLGRLCSEVQGLRADALLNRGQANALCVKMDNAARALARERTNTCINEINAFINQVEAFIAGRVLSQGDGSLLIVEARFIIGLIEEFGVAGYCGGITSAPEAIPDAFSLSAAYPNPFNSTTNLRFGLPEASNVTIIVTDLTGREIAKLADGMMSAGWHSLVWEGSSVDGASVNAGTYFIRMNAGKFVSTVRVVLVR